MPPSKREKKQQRLNILEQARAKRHAGQSAAALAQPLAPLPQQPTSCSSLHGVAGTLAQPQAAGSSPISAAPLPAAMAPPLPTAPLAPAAVPATPSPQPATAASSANFPAHAELPGHPPGSWTPASESCFQCEASGHRPDAAYCYCCGYELSFSPAW